MSRIGNIIDDEFIENVDKAKGVFFTSGQYQIIFGTGTVNRVYEAMIGEDVSSTSKAELKEKASEQDDHFFKRMIRVFGDVFVPIIPALVATGLFMGVRGLITQPAILAWFGLTPDSISDNFLVFTQILTDTAFGFLPVLVCWSTFRVFGGSPLLGIVLGLMLVSPSLPTSWDVAQNVQEPLMFLGFIKVAGYQGSVLPAFIIGIVGALLEKRIRKLVPAALDLILTPFLTLLIALMLGLFVLGPVFHEVEILILTAVTWILQLPFGIGGFIYGGINQFIVVTGLHHALNLIEIQMLSDTGWNMVNAISSGSIAAQAGAALAVGLKAKSLRDEVDCLPFFLVCFARHYGASYFRCEYPLWQAVPDGLDRWRRCWILCPDPRCSGNRHVDYSHSRYVAVLKRANHSVHCSLRDWIWDSVCPYMDVWL